MSKKKALKNQGLEFREDIYIGGGIEQEKNGTQFRFPVFPLSCSSSAFLPIF